MALELEGTLRQKLGVQQGTSARGPWAKQEFILEFPDGNFTSQACFTAFGQDKVSDLDKYQIGDRIKVSFNIKGREYNGRWYTDLSVWRISPAGQAPAYTGQVNAPAAAPSYGAAPVSAAPTSAAPTSAAPTSAPVYGAAPVQDIPAPTLDDMPGESPEPEDLPF